MERATQIRVNDDQCDDEDDDGHSRFVHFYYPHGSTSHPPVGSKVAPGGTTVRPAGGYYRGSVPASGGFGGKTTSVGG